MRLLRLLLTVTCLASCPTAASAAGINLSWDDCGSFGTELKTFACDTNSGINVLVGSVVTGIDMPQLNGQASVLLMQTNEPVLSAWWQFGFGECRDAPLNEADYLRAEFDFTSNTSCVDPWMGGAAGGAEFTAYWVGPNYARIRIVCAIAPSTSILGTDEVYVFKLIIANRRTVGAQSCAGCGDGACIALNTILMTQPSGVGDVYLTNPEARRHVRWQPGGGNIGGLGCPGNVPALRTTWGAVKGMYR